MDKLNAAKEIEHLLQFALEENLIEKLDIIPCRNALLDLFKIEEPFSEEIEKQHYETPVEILNKLLDYATEEGIIKDNTTTYRDLLDAKIMGMLMPRESEVVRKFWHTTEQEGIKKAIDDFYNLSKASNYIRTDRIAKNLYWRAATEYGFLEITINLSKPEKDPKEIAEAKLKPEHNYPKCLLCLDNLGYSGHINHPARQNHRVIPMNIAEEEWYLQYSPYAYYNEHCILLKKQHVPMSISKKTFGRLFDFIEQVPHYFIGSNADLPIVGGSILSHEHFQGGNHIFPMEKAPVEFWFCHQSYPNIKAGIVNWPMSVIRLSGKDKSMLIQLSEEILSKWREYNDEDNEILSCSKNKKEIVNHNTITPIVRRNAEGELEIDLVLRNNRISKEYPEGIFHPHRELHHIKKENIGLIEVMGLAVLPGRLYEELEEIKEILTGRHLCKLDVYKKDNNLYKHRKWIEELIQLYGRECSEEEAESYIREEVGKKFLQVLLDAGVYKRDEKGVKAFAKFMEHLGFKKVTSPMI